MNFCPLHPQIVCPVCREEARVRELEARVRELEARLAAAERSQVASPWLRQKDVAELLHVHRGTVREYQDAGILPPGRLIARADLEAAIPEINKRRAGHARLVRLEAA